MLLIAYHYPPEPAAGARRPHFLARYLPEFGWDATVLTRALELRAPAAVSEEPRAIGAPVLFARLERSLRASLPAAEATPHRASALRAFARALKSALYFPDRAVTWLPGACATGIRLGLRQRFDAVASTALPATAHLAGAALASAFRLPWLADYRDLWSENPYASRSRIRAGAERLLERAVLARAAAVTTISPDLAARLERILGRGIAVIPNGYDPREWEEIESIRPSDFELCYTGSMYDGQRSPALLFDALSALRSEGDPAAGARVVFYGPNSEHLGDLAGRYGLGDAVALRGVVPRTQALAAQRSAAGLMIFLSEHPSTYGELGSKVFEYAGARRPVLAFGPRQSVLRGYIDRHGLGWFASDLGEAKEALRQAHRRFVTGTCDVAAAPGAALDARDIARAFARRLDAMLDRPLR